MKADDRDALVGCGPDRALKTLCVGKDRYSVGFESYRLVEACYPASRAALAVDDGDLPAELIGGLLDIDPVEMGDVVLLVAREIDDRLARIRLGLRRVPYQ